MLDFNERRKLKKLLFSRVTLVLVLVAAVLLARGAWGVYGTMRETGERREMLAAQLRDLEERRGSIERITEDLESERGIEEELRRAYGVARPGEEVIILVDQQQRTPHTEATDERGWWARAVDFLVFW